MRYLSAEKIAHKLATKQPEGFHEFAWRIQGNSIHEWVGGGADPGFAPLAPAVKHQCDIDKGGECGIFVCVWCRKAMPWCWGAASGHELEDKLCDICWDERHQLPANPRTEIKMLEGLKSQSEPQMHLYTDHRNEDFFVAETLEEAKEHAVDDAEWCERCIESMRQVADTDVLTLNIKITPFDDGEEKGHTLEMGKDQPAVSKTAAEWAAFFSEGDIGAGGTGSGYFFSMGDDDD